MLGLLLLYFIGKKFSELATEYDKTKWHYVVLSIAIYYVGAIGIMFCISVVLILLESTILERVSDSALGIFGIPFGLISCYLLYIYLEKKWKREIPLSDDSVIDQIGK